MVGGQGDEEIVGPCPVDWGAIELRGTCQKPTMRASLGPHDGRGLERVEWRSSPPYGKCFEPSRILNGLLSLQLRHQRPVPYESLMPHPSLILLAEGQVVQGCVWGIWYSLSVARL